MTISEAADQYEDELMQQLEKTVPARSPIYVSGEIDPREGIVRPPLEPGQHMLMRDDPRRVKMPEAPTIVDFFRARFRKGGVQHLLQSANLAKKNGHNEKVITACLLHDIGVVGFIQAAHG